MKLRVRATMPRRWRVVLGALIATVAVTLAGVAAATPSRSPDTCKQNCLRLKLSYNNAVGRITFESNGATAKLDSMVFPGVADVSGVGHPRRAIELRHGSWNCPVATRDTTRVITCSDLKDQYGVTYKLTVQVHSDGNGAFRIQTTTPAPYSVDIKGLTAPLLAGEIVDGNSNFSAAVMAPLKIRDYATFQQQLATVESYGVCCVSVDVWWGDVEGRGDNQWDWKYYDDVFAMIKAAGLKIVPIFAFHQCGGNVGDDYTSRLPKWLWAKYANVVGPDGLKFRSEQGNYSSEYIQGWADRFVMNEYANFTTAFVEHFEPDYAGSFGEFNISVGPSGELRYPAYNSHDTGTDYPSRGALQAYSPLARKSFQEWALAKYAKDGGLKGVNAAWHTSYNTAGQIAPPRNADNFFSTNSYRASPYGQDFVDWYNQSLVDHGDRVLHTVITALGNHFPGVPIGYKVPGIHWNIGNPSMPRATEVTTGLIQTSLDTDSDTTGHGYQRIIDLAKRFGGTGRHIVLHFTALEMSDDNRPPQYSMAKSLVYWFGSYAHRSGVALKGENALAGGVDHDEGWDNITDAIGTRYYSGLTVLRISNVAGGTGARRYAQLIAQLRGR